MRIPSFLNGRMGILLPMQFMVLLLLTLASSVQSQVLSVTPSRKADCFDSHKIEHRGQLAKPIWKGEEMQLRGGSSPCLEFAGEALRSDFETLAPCAENCEIPLLAGEFEVWGNEAYSINGLTAGVEYTFEFCSGYLPTTWGSPALITVAEWDGTLAFAVIGTASGCSITFTPAIDTGVIIYVSVENDCGGPLYENQDNGVPSFTCTGGGTASAPPCPQDCTLWVLDNYTVSQTMNQILSGAPDPLCGPPGTVFTSQFFNDPNDGSPWEVFPTEAYNLPLIEGNVYSINTCTGPNTGTWPIEIVVVAPDASVVGSSLNSAPDCEVEFTATTTGIYTVYINEQGSCGLITDNWQVKNGYFAIQLVSADNCGDICGDNLCTGSEDYCSCEQDCNCEDSGAVAQFVAEDFTGTQTAVLFCEEDGFLSDIPINPDPPFIWVGFIVTGPDGGCVPTFNVIASEGQIYTTDLPPVPVLTGTILSNGIYWLKMFQSDIDDSGGTTTINLNGANGDCLFDLSINWADYGNIATLAQDICPPFDDTCEAVAGTITGDPFVCFGEEYTITGPANPTYSDDAFIPGIVYGVFNTSGPSPAFDYDVENDPNFTGNTLGSSDTGSLTWTNFSSANSVWVAPITAEDYTNDFYGECHNVGTGFQLTFLNQLNINSISISNCTVTAVFTGGQPEADNSVYTWEILDESGNSLPTPLVGTSNESGEATEIILPGSDSFILSVTDEAGCQQAQEILTNSCIVLSCPVLFTSVNTSWDLCPGEDPLDLDPIDDLGGFYTDPNQQFNGYSWYTDPAFSIVATASDYQHSGQGNNCDPEFVTLYVAAQCLIGPPVGLGEVAFTLHPQFDANLLNISNEECSVPTVSSSCPAYNITPVSVPGSVPPGSSGTATWNVGYLSDGVSCFTEPVTVNYTCAGCPVVNVQSALPTAVCSGESVSAALSITPANAVLNTDYTIQWNEDGQAIPGATGLDFVSSLSANGCEPTSIDYSVSFTCLNPGAPTETFPVGTVIVYPPYDESLLQASNVNCSIPNLTSTCDNYLINPVSVPTAVEPGQSGIAVWNVTYSQGGDCITEEYEIAYNCPNATCPELTGLANSNQDYCDGGIPNFNAAESMIAYSDPNGLITATQWYADASLTQSINTASYVAQYQGDGCLAQTTTLYVGLTCSEDPNPLAAGSLTLNIYPQYDQSNLVFSSENCQVPALTSNCSNYQVTAINVPTSVNIGDSGTASWNVSPLEGPACFSETYNGSYACAGNGGCPEITFISPEFETCEGDQISLIASVSDPNGSLSSVAWTEAGSSVIISIENSFVLDIGSVPCGGTSVTYEFTANCTDGTSVSGTTIVNSYPEISASLFVSGCSIQADPDCPEFSINGNAPGSSAISETSIPGNTNPVSFDIVNSSAPFGLACSTGQASANYNCGALVCPSIVSITEDQAICEGASSLLSISLFDPDNQINYIEWTEVGESFVYGNLSTLTVTGETNDCEIDQRTFRCSVYCFDGTVAEAEVNVSTYPIPSADISVTGGGCTIVAVPDCPIFSVNGGAEGETFSSSTEIAGDQSQVNIDLSIPAAPSTLTCANVSLTESYDCTSIGCPSVISSSNDLFVCSGDMPTLSVEVSDPSGQLDEIDWQGADGQSLGSGTSITLSNLENSTCISTSRTITAFIKCLNGSEQTEQIVVTIYPDPTANLSLSADGCSLVASSTCENFTIDGQQSPVSYSTETSGDTSTITFNIVNTEEGVPEDCSSNQVSASYNCVISSVSCPSFVDAPAGEAYICSGGTTTLSIAVSDPESIGYSINWFKVANGVESNAGSGANITAAHTNTNCGVETISYYAVLVSNDQVNCPNSSQSSSIDIDVLGTLSYQAAGSCETGYTLQVDPSCNLAGYEVSVLPSSIAPQTSSGTIPVSLQFDLACESISDTFNYDCAASECPTIASITEDQSICSGQSITLSATLSNPEIIPVSEQWTDSNGIITNGSSLVVSEQITACQGETHSYTYRVTCQDGTEDTRVVSLTIYPEPTATIQLANCSVTASPDCPNFQINGEAAGQPAIISTTEEGMNISAIFNVLNPTVAADLSCYQSSVQVNYNCTQVIGSCPTILGITGPAALCEVEQTLLTATVDDPQGTLVSAQWSDGVGNLLGDGNSLSISESVNSCAPLVQTYIFTVNCSDGSSSSSSTSVTIYPDPVGSVTFASNGCEAIYTPACPDFMVVDNAGNPLDPAQIVFDPDVQNPFFTVVNTTAQSAGLNCDPTQTPIFFADCNSSCVPAEISASAVCSTFDAFTVSVTLTPGSANSYLVQDGHGNSQQASAANNFQLTFGPYNSGASVSFSAINNDDSSCFVTSESQTLSCSNTSGCVAPIVSFVPGCTANGQYTVTATVLNSNTADSYVFDDQQGGQSILDGSNGFSAQLGTYNDLSCMNFLVWNNNAEALTCLSSSGELVFDCGTLSATFVTWERTCLEANDASSSLGLAVLNGVAPYNFTSDLWGTIQQNEPSIEVGTSPYAFSVDVQISDASGWSMNETLHFPSCEIVGSYSEDLQVNDFEEQREISWTVLESPNIDNFLVLESIDGHEFEVLTSVNYTAGNASYQVRLEKPQESRHYVLAYQSIYGSIHPLKTAFGSVENNGLSALQVSPIPVQANLNLSLNSDIEEAVDFEIRNVLGQLLRQGKMNLTSGFNQARISVAELPAGTYFLSVYSERERLSTKFVR